MTQQQEEQALRAELIQRFGLVTFNRALEMTGIRCCLQVLAADGLSPEEREVAYQRAGMHLAKLQASYITRQESAQLTECAKRIDSAFDTWTLDEIEKRDGLPPGLISKK